MPPRCSSRSPTTPLPQICGAWGIILFATLTGAIPLSGKDLVELCDCNQRGSYEFPCAACSALEELLSSLLSMESCNKSTAEITHQQWWFDPLEERTEGEEVALVQPLRVPEDPEAQEYLVGLRLLLDTGVLVPSGPRGSSQMSLQPDSRSLEHVQPCWQGTGLAVVSPHSLMALWA